MSDNKKQVNTACPYLSTIKKHLLDFDFQKVCSITLAQTNIYCCLVCGRYFQGRSSQSPAFQHSIQLSHHVYVNLKNYKIYCLPDDYEVDAYTLKDIKFNLKPAYTLDLLKKLQFFQQRQYNVDGKEFIPGAIGVNNLGHTDYATSVIYLLNSIPDIRQYFLLQSEFNEPILENFSLLLKKIWNPHSFKGIASPHQLLQGVSDLSSKKFQIGKQEDPVNFLLWLINTFTRFLKKEKKKQKISLQKYFQGKLKMSIIKGIQNSYQYQQFPSKVEEIPFTILKLQFPERGIFNKSQHQVAIQSLLEKYLGKIGQKHPEGLRYAKIIQFPQYLILVFKRFRFNGYLMEKNAAQLMYKQQLSLKPSPTSANVNYRLISQICHEGDYEKGTYSTMFKINKCWFRVEDLQARQLPLQQVENGQPYIQLYQIIRD